MRKEPASFFRFAGKWFALLEKLFYTRRGFSDGELYRLVCQHLGDEDPAPDHLITQLRDLMIIDEVPGETARWELTHPVRALLRFLLREQRLTSVEVLHGYLRALESSRVELLSFVKEGDRNGVVQTLSDVSETVERLRQDSSDNYSAILAECMRMKSGGERRSPLEKFETVNRLWNRYLMPMQDLISVDKSMEGQLDGLEETIAAGIVRFARHGEMEEVLRGAGARILRMRRETVADFHNALTDILPLYRSLKADSEFARGASAALERIERKGVASLTLDERMPVFTWKTSGLLSDTDLRSLICEVMGYTPGQSVSINIPGDLTPSVFRSVDDVRRELQGSLPVDDVLSWLEENCSGEDPSNVLRLYSGVFSDPPGKVFRGLGKREYMIRGVRMKAVPLGVAKE